MQSCLPSPPSRWCAAPLQLQWAPFWQYSESYSARDAAASPTAVTALRHPQSMLWALLCLLGPGSAICVAHAADRHGRFQGQSDSENAKSLIQTMFDRTDKVTLEFHLNYFFKIRCVKKQLIYTFNTTTNMLNSADGQPQPHHTLPHLA